MGLVDRQAAIDVLEERLQVNGYSNATLVSELNRSIGCLMRLPSADVQQVRHGHWIRHLEQKNIFGGKCVECSECGEKYVVQYIEDEKYCRNCGARMDGEQNVHSK